MADVAYDDLDYMPDGLFLLNGRPFSGVTIDRGSDGQKVCEVPFVNGREHGIARSWYPDGRLKGESPYKNGMLHGTRREFYEDGSLESEEELEFGILLRKTVRDRQGQIVETFEREPSDVLYQNVLRFRAGDRDGSNQPGSRQAKPGTGDGTSLISDV
jgi:hypothetical protein